MKASATSAAMRVAVESDEACVAQLRAFARPHKARFRPENLSTARIIIIAHRPLPTCLSTFTDVVT